MEPLTVNVQAARDKAASCDVKSLFADVSAEVRTADQQKSVLKNANMRAQSCSFLKNTTLVICDVMPGWGRRLNWSTPLSS